ncbi:Baculovirus F protein [Popillia japonica]|uniref:Baculovirus F protein n=1 Tax=Popillia japonica TaxID=7064 RepID=A0AAW1LYJ9_POPJA
MSTALNWLIGTPDADDAKYYSDSIHDLFNENKQTQTLLKSQIQIISSTIRNFNSSFTSLKVNERNLNDNIDKITSLKVNERNLNDNIDKINRLAKETNSRSNELALDSTITQHISSLDSLTNSISNEFDNYINSINLAKHGILSPQIVTPRILREELTIYKGKHELPLMPTYKNSLLYYKLLDLDVFIDSNSIVIFALKIPLLEFPLMSYNLYQLIPLPMQHKSMSIYSYIQPEHQYLLLSQPKTYYHLMEDLKKCNELVKGTFICEKITTNRRTEIPCCEVQLASPHITKIPEDCPVKNVKAYGNSLLRSATRFTTHHEDTGRLSCEKCPCCEVQLASPHITKIPEDCPVKNIPTTVTLLCDETHMEDIVLKRTGVLYLDKKCKGYTDLFILEGSNEISHNITAHYVPSLNILEDDCCLETKINMNTPIPLQPIKLTNVDLSELKYADKKLNEFDEILTNQLNKPFIVQHTNWFTLTLSVIGSIVLLMLCFNICKWFGCFNLIRRFCCFTRNPRNGEFANGLDAST